MQTNNELRLSRCEAVCKALRAEMDDVLQSEYNAACERLDADLAATLARKIRNAKLVESDNRCTLDRVLPETPEGFAFNDWLPWLVEIANHKNDEWGVYRQHLRDIPNQEGFPFDINWGEEPND